LTSPARKLEVVSNELPDPPYPADLRAKGFTFSIDWELIEQGSTWIKCPLDLRPWLLMLWARSWTNAPAGSYEADDEIIAAQIGMDFDLFMAKRDRLMRGWYPASDGRLYHDTLTSLVLGMSTRREKDRQRVANWRAAQKSGDVTRNTDERSRENDTGTGTGTGTVTGTGTGEAKGDCLPAAAPAAPAPPPPAPEPPAPPPPESSKAERGKRLPKEWKLPQPWGAWALAQGYAELDIRTEATKFRNYWVAKSGKDATKLDWEATWQNWMLGSKAVRAGAPAAGDAPITVPSKAADQTAAYLAEEARHRAEVAAAAAARRAKAEGATV
jgi:hypothetical protein